jgi:hypothetical protein
LARESEGRLYLGTRESGFAVPCHERVRVLPYLVTRESGFAVLWHERVRIGCTLARESEDRRYLGTRE